MEIADKCSEETISLTWEDEAESIEKLEVFKYAGRSGEFIDGGKDPKKKYVEALTTGMT